jgi:hypothetical protein
MTGNRMGEIDADVERRAAGTISFPGHTEFGEKSSRNPFGDGETGTAGGDGELFTSSGIDPGSGDSGSGAAKTGKRRGRPPGSGTKSPTKLSSERLATARRKLSDTLSGVVGFSLSWYGIYRAKKYQQHSAILAQAVYGCYQIKPEAAQSVGEPLADTFIQWFPQYVETAGKAIDPGLAIARMVVILQQTSENERLVVRNFQQQFAKRETQSNSNGSSEHKMEDPVNEWMNQQAPKPEEILT